MSQSPTPSAAPSVRPTGLVVIGPAGQRGSVWAAGTLRGSVWAAGTLRGSVWAAKRYDATAENESASRLIRDLILRSGDLTGSPGQEMVS